MKTTGVDSHVRTEDITAGWLAVNPTTCPWSPDRRGQPRKNLEYHGGLIGRVPSVCSGSPVP